MNDPRIRLKPLKHRAIERTYPPVRIGKDVGALVPSMVETSPFPGEDDIECVLIPP